MNNIQDFHVIIPDGFGVDHALMGVVNPSEFAEGPYTIKDVLTDTPSTIGELLNAYGDHIADLKFFFNQSGSIQGACLFQIEIVLRHVMHLGTDNVLHTSFLAVSVRSLEHCVKCAVQEFRSKVFHVQPA